MSHVTGLHAVPPHLGIVLNSIDYCVKTRKRSSIFSIYKACLADLGYVTVAIYEASRQLRAKFTFDSNNEILFERTDSDLEVDICTAFSGTRLLSRRLHGSAI